jgi:hypothetical protein
MLNTTLVQALEVWRNRTAEEKQMKIKTLKVVQWIMNTTLAGQKGQTRGPASAREEDVRQEAKDKASCFFTDL